MEYLEGHDLARLLEQRGTVPVSTACDYLIQACDAISEAHDLGIVHRDLKPGNLFLAKASHSQQIIKVLDFGISKSQGAGADFSMTSTQAVMGSPGYMSPEQMRSTKNVDGRTDIWSLGVILYELVAGRVPFYADTFSALCVKIAVDPHPPLLALPAKLPKGFEAIINRALEKDPGRRFSSAAEFAHALAPYAGAQARDKAQRLLPAPAVTAGASCSVKLGPNANTLEAASGQMRNVIARRVGKLRTLIGATAALCVLVMLCIVFTRSGGASDRRTGDVLRDRPSSGPHTSNSPPIPPTPLIDASVVADASDVQPVSPHTAALTPSSPAPATPGRQSARPDPAAPTATVSKPAVPGRRPGKTPEDDLFKRPE
jgi:serine/threonine-protein kinase